MQRAVDPDFLSRQKAALLRHNRKVVRFNDSELAAINEYCRMYGIKNKSALFRKAIMEQVLEGISQNPPTLF